MDVSSVVKDHYGAHDINDAILQALTDAGKDVTALRVEDLAAVDELHAGFLPATHYLLNSLDLGPRSRLLDLGCGIGGPARVAAQLYAAHVTGVDLTPEFVAAASALTERVGLSDRASFQATPGEALPFEEGSFDRAMMIHVGMNVPDKAALFTQVRRVLEPGGLFGIFDQMRAAEGALTYPLPWADDERSSFVRTAEEYQRDLATAGFGIERCQDRTAAVGGPATPGADPRLGPQVIFGPGFRERIENNVAATESGLLSATLILARAN